MPWILPLLAAVDYSLAMLLAGSAAQVPLTAWPFAAVLVTGGPTRALYAASVALIAGCHLALVRGTSLGGWTALGLPIGTLLFVFTTLCAALLARVRGGVWWRGTLYRLAELDPRRR